MKENKMIRRFSLAALLMMAFMAGVFFTAGNSSLTVQNSMAAGDDLYMNDSQNAVTVPTAELPPAEALGNAFANVAEAANPAVVQIRSSHLVTTQRRQARSPFEEFFFNQRGQGQQEQRAEGIGSGVIISEEGYIITNNHVVDGADELLINLYDGRQLEAKVIGTDPNSDLAVIKISGSKFNYVRMGTMDNVRIGQWVIAIGSPLSEDLGNTVTAGIVSALNRTSANLSTLNTFAGFIQTDAAINPGNSGGALLNLKGELIGINSAIYSRSGGYQGIGFAIPVDVVENIAEQLMAGGEVVRGYLGVNFDKVSPALAQVLSLPRGAAQITNVLAGTPADNAGLKVGDVVVSVDGDQLLDPAQLRTHIGNLKPNVDVSLQLVRDNAMKTVTVTLGERPSNEELAGVQRSEEPVERHNEGVASVYEALGFQLQDVDEDRARRMQLPVTEGALIVNINQAGDAFRAADLRQGDVIVSADRKDITSVDEFMEVYNDISPGSRFLVMVRRRNGSFTTALTKPE